MVWLFFLNNIFMYFYDKKVGLLSQEIQIHSFFLIFIEDQFVLNLPSIISFQIHSTIKRTIPENN